MRYRVVEQPRKRYPPKPLQRTRYARADPDPAPALAALDDEFRAMAERVLREGAFTWRRWSTIRRRSGPNFSPYAVETDLLDILCRHAGLTVIDTFRHGEWVPHRFRIDDRVRLWLGIEGPELFAELADELTDPTLLAALEAGPPPGFLWRSFAFVLRACEQLHEFARHGVRPGKRELAGLVDHTKAWTAGRIALVERLMGTPFNELVATVDRQLALRGPVAHAEGALWASRIEEVDVQLTDDARLAVLIENLETFKYLLPLAERGAVLIHVPGGPPRPRSSSSAASPRLPPRFPSTRASTSIRLGCASRVLLPSGPTSTCLPTLWTRRCWTSPATASSSRIGIAANLSVLTAVPARSSRCAPRSQSAARRSSRRRFSASWKAR